ncbi:MAG: hypothetical protein JWO89_3490, partial [Verrucomicrobiaceae bacterium]|nr:hypothetical protein [Verrucomicrobiaceae bacterium]
DYKRRIRVENSPELVEKWKELQSKGVRWVYLKGEVAPVAEVPAAEPEPEPVAVEEGAEPSAEGGEPTEAAAPAPAAASDTAGRESFGTRAEVEAHFRKMHGDDVVVEVREAILPGTIRREQVSPGLGRLFRRNLEEARKHLFELSQKIAHGLERRGMKLFKRRAGKMFVSRVKPKAVDPGVIFSERINTIVEAVRREPGILASKLVEKISPSPAKDEGEAASADPKAGKQYTDEQVAVLRDLRWLSDEGYVIEYSDGPVFLGVQGEPPQHAAEAKAAKAKETAPAPAEPVVGGASEAPTQELATNPPAEEAAPEAETSAEVAEEPAAEQASAEPEAVEEPAVEEALAEPEAAPAAEDAVATPEEVEQAIETVEAPASPEVVAPAVAPVPEAEEEPEEPEVNSEAPTIHLKV